MSDMTKHVCRFGDGAQIVFVFRQFSAWNSQDWREVRINQSSRRSQPDKGLSENNPALPYDANPEKVQLPPNRGEAEF